MPEATPNPIDIDDLLQRLTLDEKASLTAGASLWFVPPVERLGIPALKVSDGPSGVRGESLTGRRSLSLPCGMAIGSTWNPALVERMGEVLAAEARSKGVNVLLGPTVCIPRTPAGRPHLRVLLGGPAPDRPHRRGLRAGRAAPRSGLLHQALRLQRPGARADDHQRRGGRARPSGDPPRRLRSRRTGGRRLVRDDRLQQGQRGLLLRAARPARSHPP